MQSELNGYPGPAHVLELAAELQLSGEERTLTAAHLEQARILTSEQNARHARLRGYANERQPPGHHGHAPPSFGGPSSGAPSSGGSRH